MKDITLEKLNAVVNALNENNNTTYKVSVLRGITDIDVLNLIHIIYNPMDVFHITSKGMDKCQEVKHTDMGLYDILSALSQSKYSGYEAISIVNGLIEDNIEYKSLILNAIDKDLKIRVGVSLLNKALGDFIKEHKVALCDVYGERMDYVDFENDEWYASRKLDGCRCTITIDNDGNITPWSRQGKIFETLQVLVDDIRYYVENNIIEKNIVFDGEICLVNDNGDEDFQGIMKQITRKNHTIKNPMYKVFDIIPINDFYKQYSDEIFIDRQNKLTTVIDNINKVDRPIHISYNNQVRVENKEHFDKLMEDARNNNWEGLVIRKNVEYEGKRTKNLLKCKEFFDAEYVVESVEFGPFQVIENGIAVSREVLTNINITHKGYNVSVGSGFSLEQRKYYKDHPESLIGKTITVQYFEETVDQNGEFSLRFPTVKYIYDENGRTV